MCRFVQRPPRYGQISGLQRRHGLSQPSAATASSARGGTTERVNVSDFVIVKHLDKATPKLHELCCIGKHISTVTLELCRAEGDKLKYMGFTLRTVIRSVTIGIGKLFRIALDRASKAV